jgi:hypothetical protein
MGRRRAPGTHERRDDNVAGSDHQPPFALVRAPPLDQTSARHFGALKRALATLD